MSCYAMLCYDMGMLGYGVLLCLRLTTCCVVLCYVIAVAYLIMLRCVTLCYLIGLSYVLLCYIRHLHYHVALHCYIIGLSTVFCYNITDLPCYVLLFHVMSKYVMLYSTDTGLENNDTEPKKCYSPFYWHLKCGFSLFPVVVF